MIVLLTASLLFIFTVLFILKKKNMLGWLPQYIKQRTTKRASVNGPTHIIFSFVDHYEPQWGMPNDINIERSRVDRWLEQ